MMAPEELLDQAIDRLIAGEDASIDDTAFGEAGEAGEGRAAARLAMLAAATPASPGRANIRRSVLTGAIRPRRTRLRIALVLSPMAALVAFSGVAYAAQGAKPGDALYPLRRGISAVRVAMPFGDHASVLLDRAAGDLVDARKLLARADRVNAAKALDVFDGDIATARAAIAPAPASRREGLLRRAASLEAQAAALRERLATPDGSPGNQHRGGDAGDDNPAVEQTGRPEDRGEDGENGENGEGKEHGSPDANDGEGSDGREQGGSHGGDDHGDGSQGNETSGSHSGDDVESGNDQSGSDSADSGDGESSTPKPESSESASGGDGGDSSSDDNAG